MTDVLSLVVSMQSDIRRLSNRIDDFERRQSAERSDIDEPIFGLRLVASAIGLKSAKTLRKWATDLDLTEKHQLQMLLKRNPSGRWFTTRRLLNQWRRAIAANPWEVSR